MASIFIYFCKFLYVFVRYLDNEATIKEGSIGGLNTNLLPNGAKVISIDPNNLELIINYEGKDFIFKLLFKIFLGLKILLILIFYLIDILT